jgi:hypothetical protein
MMKAMWRLLKLMGVKCEEAETTELGNDLVVRSSSTLQCLVSKEEQMEEKAPPPGGRDRNYFLRLRRLENQGTEENI